MGLMALLRLSRLVLVQVAGLAVRVVVREVSFHLQLSASRAARREADGTSSSAGHSHCHFTRSLHTMRRFIHILNWLLCLDFQFLFELLSFFFLFSI